MRQYLYPFSAIVEQSTLKTALLLNAVDPSIGGVLIRGHKGSGKSTAARALTQLLPSIEVVEDCPFNSDPKDPFNFAGSESEGGSQTPAKTVLRSMPFIELPLNATEDRLVGSLHVEKALQKGERRFEPGLLAAANRGILYVDEVNLLADHLVDMLLDSAASGVNVIEREGISFIHPAHFILIGTMNPEEGELRPQFLDRFGLCAAVENVVDLNSRKLIIQRNLAHESNPEGFFREWSEPDRTISDQLVYARKHLKDVDLPDDLVTIIASLTRELHLQGHRADIAILKAARAHAALMEKSKIDENDIFETVQLAIPHRMKPAAVDPPEVVRQKIHGALDKVLGKDQRAKAKSMNPGACGLDDMAESIQVPGAAAAGSVLFAFLGEKHAEAVFEPDKEIAPAGIDVEDLLTTKGQSKRKSRTVIAGFTGRYLKAESIRPGDKDFSIAIDATLREAALRSAREGVQSEGGLNVKEDDLRKKHLVRPCHNLIVFAVDSSGSMGSQAGVPMKAAKGAALAILRKVHQNRGEVAMVAFGGQKATLILPPTSSIEFAESALELLPAGGATPFAESLYLAWQLIRSEQIKNPVVRPILVIISDGEANVSISPELEPMEELESLAEKIAHDRIAAALIDAAVKQKGESQMQRLAAKMQASYITLRDLSASAILEAVLNHESIQ